MMGSLKGDRAAQRKRHSKFNREDLKNIQERKAHAKPRMEPNVRIKSYKLEELLDDEDSA